MYQNHQNPKFGFRKSSYSATRNECVEVADAPGVSAVRDSTRPDAGHLAFPSVEWAALVEAVRTGEL
ncbi:DUF397 domain-containing protein [Allosalinactinospora lopnorensis]|uniref:DUF397 domain-containing protein n=1 Tax=Allosalinactinospora lopnorensis TaxID=1352348 RepID=UPI000623EAE1|nr:DUF397 domain-containing protein [Allosalinactinospora lopnorensis]